MNKLSLLSARSPLDKLPWGIAMGLVSGIIRTNNTPQASPVVHCRDAQTGGLLISGGGNAI